MNLMDLPIAERADHLLGAGQVAAAEASRSLLGRAVVEVSAPPPAPRCRAHHAGSVSSFLIPHGILAGEAGAARRRMARGHAHLGRVALEHLAQLPASAV